MFDWIRRLFRRKPLVPQKFDVGGMVPPTRSVPLMMPRGPIGLRTAAAVNLQRPERVVWAPPVTQAPADDGMDLTMAASLIGLISARSESSEREDTLKSEGGGDFGGGGASGSWDEPAASDDGSSSSDSSSSDSSSSSD
jgi:uncharacterized membrane protein YgcG